MAQFPFLTSLEISGFRAFSSLRIPRLGSVNLIVGKNGVGKSSVLEALQLYASNGSLSVLGRILESRDEGQISRGSRQDGQMAQVLPKIFHRFPKGSVPATSLRIGENGNETQQLRIELGQYYLKREADGRRTTQPVSDTPSDPDSPIISGLSIRRNGQEPRVYMIGEEFRSPFFDEDDRELSFHYIGANGLSDSQEVGALWDRVVLKDAEKDVLSSLRLILPELERVVIIDNTARRSERMRIPYGIIRNGESAPLRTFGEGMNRLLAIAASLVNSPSGLFLVDEIESGLHYSVQSDLWRLIFDLAERLNTQVYATTHSKDCIDAFEIAASENTSIEGRLIHLERKGDEIQAIEYEESELAIARKHELELR